ncbi:iron complex transport system permease protein [Marinobacter oulmenensis]|uniref:Iron complex transport system permease protein n=2 Tax=Marinobacter oulmenensis TaxID=643747 RepID=A0A840UFN5_9GAMM|nr:iron complex transport system permease protein [Marinobacter oulmenensis]
MSPLRSGQPRWQRHALVMLGGCLLLAAMMALSIGIGARSIAPGVALDAIVSFDPSINQHLLVRHLRIPRTLIAVLVGVSLGGAGVVMQALTRNPLADPGLLGVNAGAGLAIVTAIALWQVQSIGGQMASGLVGAGLAGAAVYLLGGVRQIANPVRLVLAGAALTFVLMALTQLIIINSDALVFDRFRHWAVGSLQGRGPELVVPFLVLAVLGLGMIVYLTRALDVLVLGRDLGRVLGVSSGTVWGLACVSVVLLSGAATAVAGPVSFVGLAAPHLARFVVGSGHRLLVPYTLLISALLVLAADMAGRLVIHPEEVAVGIMVALLGGPVFVALARRRRLVQL